jgi:hypothetical protein
MDVPHQAKPARTMANRQDTCEALIFKRFDAVERRARPIREPEWSQPVDNVSGMAVAASWKVDRLGKSKSHEPS